MLKAKAFRRRNRLCQLDFGFWILDFGFLKSVHLHIFLLSHYFDKRRLQNRNKNNAICKKECGYRCLNCSLLNYIKEIKLNSEQDYLKIKSANLVCFWVSQNCRHTVFPDFLIMFLRSVFGINIVAFLQDSGTGCEMEFNSITK